MDFVPFTYTREQKRRDRKAMFGLIGGGTVAIAQFPALLGTGILSFTTGGGVPLLMSVAGVMMGVISIMPSPFILQNEWATTRMKARDEQIRSALNEHYGLDLTQAQFGSLGYPMDHPGPGFQTFGSIKVHDQVDGGNFLERTLYLTSTDGKLGLSESRDGKRFKELKPARHTLGSSSSREALDEGSFRALEALPAPVSISA